MSTTVRSSNIGTGASGSPVSVTAPAGTTTGDVVVIIANLNNSNITITDDNGATPFTQDLYLNLSGGSQAVSVFSRRIQAGDPSTYTFTLSAGSDRWTLIAVTWQNPDPLTIYDVAPSTLNCSQQATSGTNNNSAPSITTTTANAHWCACGFSDGASNTIIPPGGFTAEQNGGNQAEAFCDQGVVTPGATGTAAFVWGTSSQSICAAFAVKDNAAAAGSSQPYTSTQFFVTETVIQQ